MSGPWERYQQAPAQGPWTKYQSREVQQPAPQQPSDPYQTAPPLLPGEPGYDEMRPLSEAYDTVGKRASGYFSQLNDALGRLNSAKDSGLLGSLEAAGTLATGGLVAPVLGTAESIALGTKPEESFARYTYQPRTESGKAQLGVLGALVSPITESGADVALAPMLAGESQALREVSANIKTYARSARSSRGGIPDQPMAMDKPMVGGKEVPAPQAQPQRPAKLGEVSIPSREELQAAAEAAYKRADEAGVVVKESSLTGLKTRIVSMAKKEGIDKDLHPDSSAVLKKIVGAKGELSLSEIETLRKVAKDAQGSIKPADKRIAGMMVDEIDSYLDNLSDADVVRGDAAKAQALKEARNFYSRAKKSEVIEGLVERAKLSAPNFSGSGMENAIRTEFRNLAKNDKKMRMFTAEEQAAIRKVAQGGKIENALRFIGKFAPTGVVSGTLAGGAATIIAGPAGAAVPAAGLAGRYAATKMTMRNVRKADELMRRGPVSSPPQIRRNAIAEEPDAPTANALAKSAADEVAELEAEAQRLKLFESDNPSPEQISIESDWRRRYKLAKERLAKESS